MSGYILDKMKRKKQQENKEAINASKRYVR